MVKTRQLRAVPGTQQAPTEGAATTTTGPRPAIPALDIIPEATLQAAVIDIPVAAGMPRGGFSECVEQCGRRNQFGHVGYPFSLRDGLDVLAKTLRLGLVTWGGAPFLISQKVSCYFYHVHSALPLRSREPYSSV